MSPPPALTPMNPNMTPLDWGRFPDDIQFPSAHPSHPLFPRSRDCQTLPASPTLRPLSFQCLSARDTTSLSSPAFRFIVCHLHCSDL